MIFDTKNDFAIKQLGRDDKIPYDLLLLAEETIEAIDKHIKDSEIFIFEYKNRVIAVYVLQIIDKNIIEIKYIAVDKNYQGQGIGKILLKDATSKALERGFKTIIIGTGDAATMQLYLYQKEGFVIFDIKKGFFLENYPEPIYENGIQLKDMVMLKKELR